MKKLNEVLAGLVFLIFPILLSAQQTVLLRNTDNETLIGAEVFQNEQFIGLTDLSGNIRIESSTQKDTLRFTYLGYKSKKVAISSLSSDSAYVILEPDYMVLKEIKVIGRTNKKISELPYQIERIGDEEIISSQAQTAAELLNKSGSVYVQKSQMGGGSPVIRGFEANKILLVIDGVRLNNAIYRNGHLQNAITIDPNALQAAEVIFGPGSLNYGSDAIGGVVHYRTKSPKLNFDHSKSQHIEANLISRFASANEEKKIHFDFNFGKEKWASFTSMSFVDFADLRSGKNYDSRYPDFGKRNDFVLLENGMDFTIQNENPEVQIGSAYRQWDVLQKFKYHLNDDLQVGLNFQYSTSSNIPRYDQLTERNDDGSLQFSEWFYGPQGRVLVSPYLKWFPNEENPIKKFFDEFILISSFQKIDEDRNSRRSGTSFLNVQQEDVNVWANTIDFKKDLGNLSFNYGLEFQTNDVKSTAWDQDINDNSNRLNALTRYPSSGSTLSNWGVYLSGNYTWDNKVQWDNGLRFSGQHSSFGFLNTDPFEWPEFYYEGFKNDKTALSWMSSFKYPITPNAHLRASVGTAFRAPNIDDLAKVRIKGDEITIPNPDLNPEETINGEIGFGWDNDHLNINFTTFYTSLTNAIVRKPTVLPNGETLYITSQNDSLFVAKNVNANSAKVYGFSFQSGFTLFKKLNWNSSISYVIGKERDENNFSSPLGHIPPIYGHSYLNYQFRKIHFKFGSQFNLKKKLEDYGGTVDNPEFATPEGALAWNIFNFYIDFTINQKLKMYASVENIFDKHYRPFSSGISAAGRNFIVSLKYQLH